MSLPLSDEDLPLIVKGLEQYNAYLVATKREDGRYQELLDRLQRKQPERETGNNKEASKKRLNPFLPFSFSSTISFALLAHVSTPHCEPGHALPASWLGC